MADSLRYPSVEGVLAIHEDVVSEYPDTGAGVRQRGDVAFALESVEAGPFGTGPETIHETAFRLLRLLVANHPFVDGNKRTALNAAAVLYRLNGRRLDYDHGVRDVLTALGTDERAVDEGQALAYLRTRASAADAPDGPAGGGPTDLGGADGRAGDESDDGSTEVGSADGRTDDGGVDGVGDDRRPGGAVAPSVAVVVRLAAADRDQHRPVYDALADE